MTAIAVEQGKKKKQTTRRKPQARKTMNNTHGKEMLLNLINRDITRVALKSSTNGIIILLFCTNTTRPHQQP